MTCKLMYISDQNDVEHSFQFHPYSLPVMYDSKENSRKPAFNAANIRCIEHVGKCRRCQ